MMNRTQVKPKLKQEVEIALHGGETLAGNIFITPDQRVVDALNDERMFLPFQDTAGTLYMVNKQAVRFIKPAAQEQPARTQQAPQFIGNYRT